MNRSTRYSKITTLNQLRNERARLDSDITNKELLLNLQYRDISEYFSIANMISLFVSRIKSLSPLFTLAQSAFNFIRSLFEDDEDTIEKPIVTKQNRRRSEKSTTPPVKESVKQNQSEVEQPIKKRSVRKPAAKRSTKKSGKSKSS